MKNMIVIVAIACLLLFAAVGEALDNEGLVLYLPFNEGSGNMAGDLSPEGNDGTINGAEWIVDGKIGSALSFEVGNYVEVAHSASLSITDESGVQRGNGDCQQRHMGGKRPAL